LTEQIKENRAAGLDDYHAVIEATVQRTRPVILTALAAVLAFIPLTHSVFWGSMAYTLIGGTAVGTVLILLFLPALYAAWFRIKPAAADAPAHSSLNERVDLRTATAAEYGSVVGERGSRFRPLLLMPAEK
jgi:predicted RND superfamily exporter protein